MRKVLNDLAKPGLGIHGMKHVYREAVDELRRGSSVLSHGDDRISDATPDHRVEPGGHKEVVEGAFADQEADPQGPITNLDVRRCDRTPLSS
jgi:hypothetical protein